LHLRFTMKVTVCLDLVSVDFLFVFSVTLIEAKCSVQTYPQTKACVLGADCVQFSYLSVHFFQLLLGQILKIFLKDNFSLQR